MIKRYVKKPVTIEAVQWTGSNLQEFYEFTKIQKVKLAGYPPYKIIIPTLEGDHIASPGDYIIKGIKGEFYPCKPDIFNATYDEVNE